MDKEEYFRRLYALGDNSDGEEDTNNTRDIIKQGVFPISSSQSFSEAAQQRRSQKSKFRNKVPMIHRTNSAPVASTMNEMPALPRKSSLLRYDISTPEINTSFSHFTTPSEGALAKPKSQPARSASTPNIGTIVMKNSTGIASMLGKKRKRKEQLIKLVPENDRIFAGKIFYYVPPDDNAPVRRLRITRARNYGATWTTEWIPSITHVVVDKGLTYSDVMTFLKPVIDADALPPNVILVNEDYPINCTQYMSLLDSKQTQYIVNGYGIELEKPAALKSNSPEPDNSLQVKPSKSKKWDDLPDKQTPPRSKSQSQRNLVHGETGSSPGLWLVPQERDEAELVQSSEQPAPLDIDSSKNSVGSADDTPFGSFSGLGGALKQAIEEARMYQHLPLDDDDDDNYRDRPSSSEGPEDSDDSERDRSPIRKPKRKKKGTANQANYSCMQGGTGIAVESNPNGVTISILEEMAEYYDRVKDHWRTTAYRRAIGTMKRQTRKIVSYDEAIVLPHIGHRIATKIEEIALTNRLRRLDHIKLEPNDLILQTFMKVYGAAADQASKWIKAGHKTLDDLRAHAKLTEKQQIGLDHYDDFNTRIP